MSRLFDRYYRLQLDRVVIEGTLDIEAKIEKTDKAEPNKAQIKVFNLNPDHRDQLLRMSGTQIDKSQRKPIFVELDAGYADNHGVIFSGDLRNLETRIENKVDISIVVFGHDGGHKFKTSTIEKSFAKGTPLATAIRACAEAMGVGTGNVDEVSGTATIPGLGKTLPQGIVLHGPAWSQLDRLLKSAGLEWSIQDNNIIVTERGKPLNRSAIRLSPETGLIGSPETEVTTDVVPGKAAPPKTKHGVKAKALIQPGLYPKRKVILDTENFKNRGFVISSVEYNLQSGGNDWYADMILLNY
jgi:hypothetical protein